MAKKIIAATYRAPDWRPDLSECLILWHGTTSLHKTAIERDGIDLTKCAVDTDFGRGFYTTTVERQARLWAWEQFYRWQARNPLGTGNQPVVLCFRVCRYSSGIASVGDNRSTGLDRLRSLSFVRGEYDHEDFWSLVQHCRQSTPTAINDHRCPGGWYDCVSGPVAAFWEQRVAMADADQFSFHTPDAIAILQDLIAHGAPGYTWDPVV